MRREDSIGKPLTIALVAFVLFSLAILVIGVVEARGADKPADPPAISDAMQTEYTESQAALELATLKADAAQAKLDKALALQRAQKAVSVMQAVCPLTLDQKSGKVQCAPKPEPVKEEAKKP